MRVIAGVLRGRRLRAPRGRDTRPTPERVREALFSMLGDLAGCRVLDLYAGSGALAIEALSRGATHAVLVERGRAALAALRENLRSTNVSHCCRVVAADVGESVGLVRQLGPFDLVFVDPPYADVTTGRLTQVLDRLLAPGTVVADEGRLVVEHAARDERPALQAVQWVRTRGYGDTAVSLYVPRDDS